LFQDLIPLIFFIVPFLLLSFLLSTLRKSEKLVLKLHIQICIPKCKFGPPNIPTQFLFQLYRSSSAKKATGSNQPFWHYLPYVTSSSIVEEILHFIQRNYLEKATWSLHRMFKKTTCFLVFQTWYIFWLKKGRHTLKTLG